MKNFTPQSSGKSSGKRSFARSLFVPSEFRKGFLSELKGAPLSVLCAYQSYANREGLAWPSLRTLARDTGYGINAVKAARRKLIDLGLLIPVDQSREAGRFCSKQFQVCTVVRKQCHGTVASSTVARKQCHEVSPSEGSSNKK